MNKHQNILNTCMLYFLAVWASSINYDTIEENNGKVLIIKSFQINIYL